MSEGPRQEVPVGAPRREPFTTGILDISHHNAHGDLHAAGGAGVGAIICKVTEGKDYRDKSAAAFLAHGAMAGMLLGVYHFGSNSAAGAVQADHFLASTRCLVTPAQTLLLCLDWENNPNHAAGTMSRENARAFCSRVREVTGIHPVLYTGLSFGFKHAPNADDVLSLCPLWIAKYGEEPRRLPPSWARFALWQYTNGTAGPTDRHLYPRVTAGFGRADRSCFRGTAAELAAWWTGASARVFAPPTTI